MHEIVWNRSQNETSNTQANQEFLKCSMTDFVLYAALYET